MVKFQYLKSLIDTNTSASSNNFGLVVSVLIGGLLGLIIGFCLVWDVVHNGYIKTDLSNLCYFLFGVSAYMAGGGLAKVVGRKEFQTEEKPFNKEEEKKG